MTSYTSRRTYLLNRAAWGLVAFAAIYAIFGGASKSWLLVIVLAALAGLCWFLAGNIEKKRRNRHDAYRDEHGNIRPNKR